MSTCRLLLFSLLILSATRCHRPRLPRLQPATSGASPPSAVDAPSGAQRQGTCPGDASDAELDFCHAAARAIHTSVEDDSDDAAPLLSLLDALETSPGLTRLQQAWHPPLRQALARAHLLSSLARPLRQLKRAVWHAYLDPHTGLYRGVDSAACRAAFAELQTSEAPWQELSVTLEPLGTYTLSMFRRFCFESRTLEAPRP